MNPLAHELNENLSQGNPHLFEMLSHMGKRLFFPKGILTQSAEAKEKAFKTNATIGIAMEDHKTMHFRSLMDRVKDISPEESLTYAPSFGIPALRKAWQAELYSKNPSLAGKRISLPVVTCGVTHAVSTFADMWVDPEDTVVLPDKIWGNYTMILNVKKGAKIVQFPFFSERGGFNLKAFEEALRQEAKSGKVITILNFPNNPTGYSPTRAEGEAIVDVLTRLAREETRIIAAFDDAYFGLFYDDAVLTESLFAKLSQSHPRLLAVKLDGATKENFVWGLRVGFITYGCWADGKIDQVYEALEKKTAGCIRGTISNASHLSQTLILKSMADERYAREKNEKYEILKQRAQRVQEVLKAERYQDAWDVYPFNSGYFMCLRLKSVDAEKLRVYLLEKYGVGLISIGSMDLRVAFSCLEENEIPGLFDLILSGVRDLTSG
jgi:aspartate/methionine/tyrosine aminotransferase